MTQTARSRPASTCRSSWLRAPAVGHSPLRPHAHARRLRLRRRDRPQSTGERRNQATDDRLCARGNAHRPRLGRACGIRVDSASLLPASDVSFCTAVSRHSSATSARASARAISSSRSARVRAFTATAPAGRWWNRRASRATIPQQSGAARPQRRGSLRDPPCVSAQRRVRE
jgi:hypothetical protein